MVVTFCPATIETLTSAEGGGVTLHHRALNGIGEGVVVADFGAPGSYEAYVRVRSDGFAYQGMRWVGVYAPWATKPRPDEAKRVGCVTTRSGAMIIGSSDGRPCALLLLLLLVDFLLTRDDLAGFLIRRPTNTHFSTSTTLGLSTQR